MIYDRIYELAVDNHGLITSAEAKEIGISNADLVQLAHRGRLTRIGHGVYRIYHYVPDPNDAYATAVILVGKDAYLYGVSVLAMHNLALVNPHYIYVATSYRVRKKIPPHIMLVPGESDAKLVYYDRILSQSVLDALLTCRPFVMSERLNDAIDDAVREGLITETEATMVRKEVLNEYKTA